MNDAPSKDNVFYYSKQNAFFPEYGYANCTWYAHGRYAEITGVWLPALGNAEDWIEVIKKTKKYIISSSPKLGAVACWKCGKVKCSSDGAGHVAIVEQICANGDIITSNSAWKGTPFYIETFKANKKYSWTSKKTGNVYDLQGFIYSTINFTEEPKTMHTIGSLNLRSGAGTAYELLSTMKKGSEFKYDGIYEVVNNTKWLHGCYISSGPSARILYTGWASAKYLK